MSLHVEKSRPWKPGALRLDQAYDALRRPTTKTVTIGSDPATIREIIEYGEGVTSAELSNLRGKPFQQWDTAGRVTFDSYDFPVGEGRAIPLDNVRNRK